MNGETCEHGDHRCSAHFTELSVRALAHSPGGPYAVVDVVNHLIGHGWGTAAMMTWTAMFGRYSVPDGCDRGEVVPERIDMGIPELADQPWTRLLETLVRAAMVRDGHNAIAAIGACADLPHDQRASFVASLLTSTARLVERRQTPARHVNVMHLYGCRVDSPSKMEVLDDLVDATIGFYDDDRPAVERAMRALHGYDISRAVSAMTLASALLSEMADEGTTVLLGSEFTGEAPTGILDWQDHSRDARRSMDEQAACWAMRMAAAHARDDTEQIVSWIAQSDDQHRFLFMITFAAVSFIARVLLRMDMDLMAEHGTPPPPGHPG